MDLGGVATLTGMLSFIVKLMSFFKYLSAKKWREVVTQLIVWGAGLAAVWIFGMSKFTRGITVGDGGITIGSLDAGAKIILGLTIASVGSFAYDFKKALDGTDSAGEPPLGG